MSGVISGVALGRDPVIGPDPTWEALPEAKRREWLSDIRDFPPPPMFLELLDGDLRYDKYVPQALADKLSHDPVLAGHLLARANSAAFGLREPVTSLRRAMVHLGFNLVRSTVLRHQVEVSVSELKGLLRSQFVLIQRSTDQGAVLAFNWASALKLPDPASIATRCLLGRLGTFLIARRFPERMYDYFAAGHEPQRLNFEANTFGVTSRTLTYKVAQAWQLPLAMQRNLYHLWTPLFAEYGDASDCVASAGLALGFDPPHHLEDITRWLDLLVHWKLRDNLEACGALRKLPAVLDSETYRREMAVVAD
jgi:HD-like signal output (HDOD) protein